MTIESPIPAFLLAAANDYVPFGLLFGGIVGAILLALGFRRDETSKLVNTQSTMFGDALKQTEEYRERLRELRAEHAQCEVQKAECEARARGLEAEIRALERKLRAR